MPALPAGGHPSRSAMAAPPACRSDLPQRRAAVASLWQAGAVCPVWGRTTSGRRWDAQGRFQGCAPEELALKCRLKYLYVTVTLSDGTAGHGLGETMPNEASVQIGIAPPVDDEADDALVHQAGEIPLDATMILKPVPQRVAGIEVSDHLCNWRR